MANNDKQSILTRVKLMNLLLGVLLTVLSIWMSFSIDIGFSIVIINILCWVYLIYDTINLINYDKKGLISTVYAYCDEIEKDNSLLGKIKGSLKEQGNNVCRFKIISINGESSYNESDEDECVRYIEIRDKAKVYSEGTTYCFLFKTNEDMVIREGMIVGKKKIPITSNVFENIQTITKPKLRIFKKESYEITISENSDDEWDDSL